MDGNVSETKTINIKHAITWNPEETVVTLVLAGDGRIPADALKEVLEHYVGKLSATARISDGPISNDSVPPIDQSNPICGAV